MATWYVRTSGSDSNAGTSAGAAFLTITKAMTQASLAAGDTIYVGAGTYRPTAAIVPTSMASMTYLYGDTDGSKTGDAGEIIVTDYVTNDSTAPTAMNIFDFSAKAYWTIGKLTIHAGAIASIPFYFSYQSSYITMQDCTLTAVQQCVIGNTQPFSSALNITMERCRMVSSFDCMQITSPQSASGASYSMAITIRNCLLIGGRTAFYCGNAGSQTYKGGGISIRNCHLIAAGTSTTLAAVEVTAGSLGTTYPLNISNSFISGQYAIASGTSGQIVEDYNVISYISSARTNVTAGSNSKSDGSRSWRYSLGHEASYGGVTRSFGEFPAGSPLLAWGGTSVPTDDINCVTRPASGEGQATTKQALGPFERGNSGTKDATTYRTAAPSLKIAGPGYQDFEVPVSSSHATTITAYVRRDANYTGTNPSINLINGGECGVADATATDAGSASAWNQLTLGPFTPTADGIVTVRFLSSSTAATGTAWIDDFGYS